MNPEDHADQSELPPADPPVDAPGQPDANFASINGEWPTHGGYLGCLMGMFVCCVLAGFLASESIAFLHFARSDARIWFILAAVVVMILLISLGGRLGWGLGKRLYRDYQAESAPSAPEGTRSSESA